MVILFLSANNLLFAQGEPTKPDSTITPEVKVKEPPFRYFRLGLDLSKILNSAVQSQYNVWEAIVESRFRKDVYMAAEVGWGNSTVSNDYLKYKSNNGFLRIGVDKTFFGQEHPGDLDNAFVGIRYAIASIKRNTATYQIEDPVWGNSEGTVGSTSFLAHWLELNGGFRLEVKKHIFIGWNIRARTFINPKKFEQLPPAYVAGYGRGDKNTSFGYNFYLMYGIGKR